MTDRVSHDCCSVPASSSIAPSKDREYRGKVANKATCPACGHGAGRVDLRTLKSLLTADACRQLADGQHYYCQHPECDTVYFDPRSDRSFTKADLTVRVGVKETEDPIPVCYCFGHTKGSIREEIERAGHTDVVEVIRREIHAGNCACEVKNPSGKCCLGDITRAVREIEADVSLSEQASADVPSGGSSACGC